MYWRYAPVAMPLAVERGQTMTYEKMRSHYIRNKPVMAKKASRFLFENHRDFRSEYVWENVDRNMSLQASHESGRLLADDLVTTFPECMDMSDRCVHFKKSAFSYSNASYEYRVQ